MDPGHTPHTAGGLGGHRLSGASTPARGAAEYDFEREYEHGDMTDEQFWVRCFPVKWRRDELVTRLEGASLAAPQLPPSLPLEECRHPMLDGEVRVKLPLDVADVADDDPPSLL